jgi:hypothetical protein
MGRGACAFCHCICREKGKGYRGQSYKTFYGRNFRIFVISYCNGKPFQPSLMFVGKARSLPQSGAPERCFTPVGSGRLYRIGPRDMYYKTFTVVLTYWRTVFNSNHYLIFADKARSLPFERSRVG